jgi:hypothetical protein
VSAPVDEDTAGVTHRQALEVRHMPSVVALPERLAQGVAERVVALVVASLDLDALIADVDVNALLDQVDVDRLLARVDPGTLVDRLDVNAVLDRIDVDRLLARVDVNALLARTDLASTVADAATSTAGGGLDALRRTAARADDTVAGWCARLLGRA